MKSNSEFDILIYKQQTYLELWYRQWHVQHQRLRTYQQFSFLQLPNSFESKKRIKLLLLPWKKINLIHTSGASPMIHLQSGENASGQLDSRSSVASLSVGILCSSSSSSGWKWSQSAGSFRSAIDAGISPSSYAGLAFVSKPPANKQPLFSRK